MILTDVVEFFDVLDFEPADSQPRCSLMENVTANTLQLARVFESTAFIY